MATRPGRRWVALLLPGILLAATPAAATATASGDGVRTVDVRRVTAEALQRPGPAFGLAQTDGNRTVLRTDPAIREGLHFEVALRLPAASRRAVAAVEVSWIEPGSNEPRSRTFAAPGGLAGPDATLAFTGSEDPGTLPVAWRIRFLDASGAVLAGRASYLWTD